MNANPAAAPGPSLTALRRAETTARNVRGFEVAGVPSARGLYAVPESGEVSASPSFLRGHTAEPAAETARGGLRLDNQGRVTCKKLVAALGWEPHVELEAHVRLDQPIVLVREHATHGLDVDGQTCGCGRCVADTREERSLDDGWFEVHEPVDITGKWELQLAAGMCHAAGLAVPGEIVAFALPAPGGLVITSTTHAVTALISGLPLPGTPT